MSRPTTTTTGATVVVLCETYEYIIQCVSHACSTGIIHDTEYFETQKYQVNLRRNVIIIIIIIIIIIRIHHLHRNHAYDRFSFTHHHWIDTNQHQDPSQSQLQPPCVAEWSAR